jgi:NAD(P)-dependent dehydrogenase (short-subunit alcohol dehydrogenase family)
MNSLAQHIAVEETDITTVAIGPGRVDTPMQHEIREQGKGSMTDADHANFVSAYEDGKLNKPEGPGTVIAKLSLDATPDLSGKYLRCVERQALKFHPPLV